MTILKSFQFAFKFMYQIKIFFLNSFSFKVEVGDGVYSEHFKVIMHVTSVLDQLSYLQDAFKYIDFDPYDWK